MSQTQNIEQLVARVDSLEKKNRRFRGFFAVGILSAFFLVPLVSLQANGKNGNFDTVTAKKIAVMDDTGKVRIIMSANKRRTTVGILGAAGKVRIAMALTSKGDPILSLNGGNEKPRATLTSSRKNGPSLILFNEAGKADALIMSRKKNGGGALMMLKGKDGKVIKTFK
jgi:hypothetical protein